MEIKECMQRNDLLRKRLPAETKQKTVDSVLKETRASKLNVLIKAYFFSILRNDQT